MYRLRLYMLLLGLAVSVPLSAQLSPLRIGAEIGGTSSNLRISSGKSSGALQPTYGVRLGVGAEVSLGLLSYLSAGIYYQGQGARNDLTLTNARPIGYPSAVVGREQVELRYLSVPVAYGLRLALPGGIALSGEAGLSYAVGLSSSYQHLPGGGSRDVEYPVLEGEEAPSSAEGATGERLVLKRNDLSLHLAAKLEIQKIFLRIGVEQGLRDVTKHSPTPMKNTTGWFTLGIRLL